MDLLSPYHAVLDFFSKTLTLFMPSILLIVWTGANSHMLTGLISFLRAQRLGEKWCLAYFTYVRDTSGNTHSLESVHVVREFFDVYPTNLPGFPSEYDINFSIDIEPGTELVYIL